MNSLHRFLVAISVVLLVLVGMSQGKDSTPPAIKRPPIVGIAWISLRTADMAATRKFYTGYLGLEELRGIKDAATGGLTRAVFKINDHQFVHVLPELKDPKQDRLIEIAFETPHAEQLRAYLASKGVKVPEHIESTSRNSHGFAITDAEGHVVKFVEFGQLMKLKVSGKAENSPVAEEHKPDNRVSSHMIHTGFIVNDRASADHLFKDILEFKETWHGGMTDDKISWVDMRVPEGKDWLEYMVDVHNPDPRLSGIMNHLALGVPNIKDGYDMVVKRGLSPEQPKIGRDGKWQLNLYGPDLTRVELMEPKPVQTPCCSPILQ